MSPRLRRFTAIAGIGLVVVAIGWRLFAVPALVRFPTDLDDTFEFTGMYTSYFDERTLEERPEPLRLPFSLTRHLEVVDHSFSTVVIAEELQMRAGDDMQMTQRHQYVMDRRTMELKGGPDSWAFDPSNVVDRSGSYRLQFPMGIDADGDYAVWNNETGVAVPLGRGGRVHSHSIVGVDVMDFQGSMTRVVAPAYREWLAAQGFPMSVSPAQLQARLAAEGIDAAAVLADVGPLLTPEESALVADVLSRDIPLIYEFVYEGMVSIEPRTGAVTDVHTQREGLAVRPDLSGVADLQPLLDKYAAVPSVQALGAALERLQAAPAALAAEFQFSETPASSQKVGDEAKRQIRLMNIVERWIPASAGLLGVALLAVAIATRPRPRPRPTEPLPEATDERVLTGAVRN